MYFNPKTIVAAALSALLATPSMAASTKYETSLMASPFMTATMVRDQFEDKDFVFDFNPLINKNDIAEFGGQAVAAQITQFPALVNTGVGQVLLSLDACGMNAPHTHPRGSEILFSINGDFLTVTIEENGSTRVIENIVKPFQSTVFQQGILHTEVNLGCEPAMFISSFNSEDPGLVTALQQLFLADSKILEQSFQQNARVIEDLADDIPTNVAPAIHECRKRCFGHKGKEYSGY